MKKFVTFATLAAFSFIGPAAFADDKKPKGQAETRGSGDNTVSGCLMAGTDSNTYVLTDKASGRQIAVMGSPKLQNHVNHEVKLTGQMKAEGNQQAFHVTDIQHLASSCDSGASRQQR